MVISLVSANHASSNSGLGPVSQKSRKFLGFFRNCLQLFDNWLSGPEKFSGRAPGQWLTVRTDKVLLGVAACVSMCLHSSLLLTLLLIFFFLGTWL